MRADRIKLSDLKTWQDCCNAITCIETDYVNVVGGLRAWNSCRETKLTKTAQQKIDAIERKLEQLDASNGCQDG